MAGKNIINRTQRLVPGLFVLMLALSVGLAVIVQAAQPIDSTQQAQPGQFVALPSPAAPPLTASEGYQTALSVAHDWAEDAKLWRGQATWSSGRDLKLPPPAWHYTFYSAAEQSTALIQVTSNNADMITVRPVSQELITLDVEKWHIDSPAAYEILFANGGEAFLTIHPRRSLIMTLLVHDELRWHATLINEGPIGNAAGQQMLDIVFSAQDGSLITRPIHGAGNE